MYIEYELWVYLLPISVTIEEHPTFAAAFASLGYEYPCTVKVKKGTYITYNNSRDKQTSSFLQSLSGICFL